MASSPARTNAGKLLQTEKSLILAEEKSAWLKLKVEVIKIDALIDEKDAKSKRLNSQIERSRLAVKSFHDTGMTARRNSYNTIEHACRGNWGTFRDRSSVMSTREAAQLRLVTQVLREDRDRLQKSVSSLEKERVRLFNVRK